MASAPLRLLLIPASIVELGPESRATMYSAGWRMGGIGIKHGPEGVSVTEALGNRRKQWVGIAAVLGLALAIFVLVRSGGLERWMAPGFEVGEVRPGEGIMKLKRANHIYVVRCDSACSGFRVGQSYRMQIVVGELRYKATGREISLPILEEQVEFTGPGGHG